MARPSGAVTFLFTDVEGSTRLWAEHTEAMERALTRHDGLLRRAIDAHAGSVFSTAGDSFAAAFHRVVDAASAALDGQLALHAEPWPELPQPLRVRMGLHTGVAYERGGDYFGPEVNLAARVMAAAWGGQILCTGSVMPLADVTTEPLGEHRLRDIPGTTSLHQLTGTGLPSDFPAPRTLDVTPSTLPAQRSTFVGRHGDIDAVRRLLLDHRLVTLTGPGGAGKTRLAIEIAGREQPLRPGGTYFADLGSLDGGEHVAATCARACMVLPDAGRSPLDQVIDALGDRAALLVLDNCEHVLDAAADLVDRLLDACPAVRVVTTSRAPLELPDEHLQVVGPLETERGSDAVRLFVERSHASGADGLDPGDAAIGALCARLDGMPLAIELAAARTRTMSPTEILARVDRRLDAFGGGGGGRRRGTPERHQTLRAAIDWSYDLLDDAGRALFDRLAVLAGTFDTPAAAAVMGGEESVAEEVLAGLVARSMVATQEVHNGRRRFRLLDTLRAYADERLRERPEAFDAAMAAHAAHYVARLDAVPMSTVMARDLCVMLEPDLDNLRAAFDRDVPTPGTHQARATIPLLFLLVHLGLIAEARARCDAMLAADDLDVPVRGRLLIARAYMDGTEDGASDFGRVAQQALGHLAPGDGVWAGAVGLTSVPLQMFAPDDEVPRLDRARARLDGLVGADADHDRAVLDFYLAGALMNQRRFDRGTEVFVRSVAVMRSLEPTSLFRLWSASGAAIGQTMLDEPGQALRTLDEVADLAGWTDWTVEWTFARSLALARSRRIGEARQALLAIGERLGSDRPSPLVTTVVAGFGVLAAVEGRSDRATELLALVAASRSPASTAAVYEVIGQLEGWGDEEFADRKRAWVVTTLTRQHGLERGQFFSRLGELVREEVAAFS
jgi:predicted ATPase/class 3 adenylate cyclase